ncbi:MAG: FemAB family PEP-CTERM system-associated protein [Rhodospirillaceae bacterium]|jgi:FemAB-related protein (PEP-CTERM system-associated)|nr:FemAB family PEP-CTERM system-associated protein [Rhodospirillaceae bacterium]MBT5667581.1 FemAB family PEP-CTERM system-associated protein [Rhodospirillaceae bacterium]MBT5811709.1 FemAB family PEP-CTERM system-associated protein [Rhodospirillaceae bacterium]
MNQVTSNLQIRPLTGEDNARWDTFVLSHENATFFHRAGWSEVIRSTFGHDTYFVYAERDGDIIGILSLVHNKSRLFGNRLVSTSFCVHGGPLTIAPEANTALDAYAEDLAEKLDVDFLEYRSAEATKPDWQCQSDLYYVFRREISDDADANLKAIPRKQRAVVRKAIKAEQLSVEIDDGPDRFYKVYSISVRNLGSPVFSKRYCQNLKRVFGDDCEFLILVGPNGEAVSGVLQFYFRDEVLPYYGGGTPDARKFGAHDYMYWQSMCRAAERGVRIFDFGRSKANTGAFSFKKNWGFEPQPLYYEYKLKPGHSLPDTNTLNPKYQIMINCWKRLPLPIANTIGPHLVSALG